MSPRWEAEVGVRGGRPRESEVGGRGVRGARPCEAEVGGLKWEA